MRTIPGSLAIALLSISIAANSARADDDSRLTIDGDAPPKGALARLGSLRFRHGAEVTFVAFSRDGKGLFLIASQEASIKRWDLKTGMEQIRFTSAAMPRAGELNPTFFASGFNNGGPYVAALSADGKILAAVMGAGQLKTVQLWDADTGKELRSFAAPLYEVRSANAPDGPPIQFRGATSLAFSPTGTTLAVRSSDRSVHLFDTVSGKEIRKIQIPKKDDGTRYNVASSGGASGFAYAPDGKTVASAESYGAKDVREVTTFLKINSVESGKELARIDAPAGLGGIAYHPGGKILAYASGRNIHLWDLGAASEIRQIDAQEFPVRLLFSPDGKTLAAKGRDEVVRIFDPDAGTLQFAVGTRANGNAAQPLLFRRQGLDRSDFAFSPDGKLLAAADNATVRIWETATGKEMILGGGHRGEVTRLAPTADGKSLLSFGSDNVVRRWELASKSQTAELQTLPVTSSVAIFPQSGAIAQAVGGIIRVQDVDAAKEKYRVPGPARGANALAASLDGKRFAARSHDSPIHVYDAQSGREVCRIDLPTQNFLSKGPAGVMEGRASRVAPIAIAPDGRIIASRIASPGAVPFESPKKGPKGLKALKAPKEGDVLGLWDIPSGKEIRKITLPAGREMNQLAFSPDGRLLAIENHDTTISLMEVASGTERCLLGTPMKNKLHGGYMDRWLALSPAQLAPTPQTLTFSRDGLLLASTRAGEEIRLWDVRAAHEAGGFKGHALPVTALAFAADGKTLFSGSQDTTILAWDMNLIKRQPAPPPAELVPEQLEQAWAELAEPDAAKAYRAMVRLAAAPKQAAKLLRDRLKPAPAVDAGKMARLLGALNSDRFETRERARAELESLGDLAVVPLQQLLATGPTLENRRRVEPILDKLQVVALLNAEQIRLVRAIEVLERLDTAEARDILTTLAGGAPGALPTREARAALARLTP